MADRTSSGCAIFVSIGDGATAPNGTGSSANDSNPPLADHRAAATCVAPISATVAGCGIAVSQRSSRRTGPKLKNWLDKLVAALLNEGHLVYFA
jgi:hypothetical protein